MATVEYLPDTLHEFRRLKRLADDALAQVADHQFFTTLDPGSNSLAVILKHLAGNMCSRWTDFLTTDGEKPDGRRDTEFVIEPGDTRAALMDRWEAGWQALFRTIEPLKPEDLGRSVLIRAEPYTVLKAIQWQVSHYGYHVGQIVLLAKHFAGPAWRSLSIPKAAVAASTANNRGT